MTLRRCALALTATLVAGCLVPPAPAAAAPTGSAGSVGPASPAADARSLCAPPTDTVGPVASKVTFGRPSIDLQSGSRVQSVTVSASDASGHGAASGVAQVRLEIEGDRFFSGVPLTLTSGTSTSGNWTGRLTVSRYARAGTYSIAYLDVVDAAGNDQIYSGYDRVPEGPNALSLHPADDPTFAVTGTPATRPARRRAGSLAAFAFSRYHVNTTASRRHIRAYARFRGPAPRRVSVEINSTRKSRQTRFVYLNARLHHRHRSWSGTIIIPQWLGKQDLAVSLFADYGAGYRPSSLYDNARQLRRSHFANTVVVVSRVDHSRPRLTSLSLSPDPIDSTTGAERVTVTATATDTGSGVRSINVDGGIRNGVNGVSAGAYPFAGSGIGYISSQNLDVRLRKTAQGTWVGSTVVKQCVPSGLYKLSAELRDVAGNFAYDSTNKLARAHITSTVAVTSEHGDIAPPYVYSAATYGADNELFLNFSEGVARVSPKTLTVYPLTPVKDRYTAPVAIASIVCSDGTQTVDCSGAAGLATSAVLSIPGLKPGQKYGVWADLDQVVPQLADGNGNPMNWNYPQTEVIDS